MHFEIPSEFRHVSEAVKLRDLDAEFTEVCALYVAAVNARLWETDLPAFEALNRRSRGLQIALKEAVAAFDTATGEPRPVELPLYVLYIFFFVGGFAYPAKCLTFASICEIMPLKMSGVSVAFVNMIVMATGVIFHPLIGGMINAHWNGAMLNNIPYYTVEDYRFALIIIPALLILSGVISFFMKETHPDHEMPKEYGPVIDTDVL